MADIFNGFYRGKRVLVTGHTGFKGSWLCLWLQKLGAEVMGFAQDPPTVPSHYEEAKIAGILRSQIGDIRDYDSFSSSVRSFEPEIVFHLAAQALVRRSYDHPLETMQTNIMGTVHLLEILRSLSGVKSVIIVTSDKCYENREWIWGYRENDALGGDDPYSGSKACAELVTHAYRQSFFHPAKHAEHGLGLASTRAGNVIGGGDWGEDRLIPDCIKSLSAGKAISIRHPQAVRPWQFVLEPLFGYLLLARALYENGRDFSGAWNFGPENHNLQTVEWIVKQLYRNWGIAEQIQISSSATFKETGFLNLDSTKSRLKLQWRPQLTMSSTLSYVVDWYKAFHSHQNMLDVSTNQIAQYENLISEDNRMRTNKP